MSGDAAGPFPERAQALVLQHPLLALPQVFIGLLQGVVYLGLMRGQGDVLAELPEELAVRAAEPPWFPPGGHQRAEHLALQQQWCHHQRAQSLRREPSGEGEIETADVGLVDQLTLEAACQAVAVDR